MGQAREYLGPDVVRQDETVKLAQYCGLVVVRQDFGTNHDVFFWNFVTQQGTCALPTERKPLARILLRAAYPRT